MESKRFHTLSISRVSSFIVLSMICHLIMPAQSLSTDDGIRHWEADFRAGLNTDGYQFSFGAAYFPIQYAGVRAQIGLGGEIEEIGDWGKDELETHHSYAARFKFIPALVLRTPRLIHWKSQGAGIYLFAEPGLVLSPGASGSRNARCVNWDFKAGVNMQIDRFILMVGYGISDFSLYSGYPHNHWGASDPDNYITHSGFIGGAYKF